MTVTVQARPSGEQASLWEANQGPRLVRKAAGSFLQVAWYSHPENWCGHPPSPALWWGR